MSVKLLTEHHLEFLSLKKGCTGSSEATLVKMPHYWKSHVEAQFYLFFIMQVILSIVISWILCLVLTVTDTIPNNSTHPNYMSRTDVRLYVVDKAPWFYWPYPCK